MPVSLSLIMAFVGAGVALLIGTMIFGQISEAIQCPTGEGDIVKACENAKSTGWTVIAILPIALFFVIFSIFGGLGGDGFGDGIKMPKIPRIIRKHGKDRIENISFSQKIMLFLGLAKVKKEE